MRGISVKDSAMKGWPMKGWMCALFIAAVGHPVGNVVARLVVSSFHANPLAYTCMVMIAASFALLVFAKPGPLGIDTLRRPETWGYGVLQTFIYAIGVYVVLYVSGTEASVVMRITTSIMFILSVVMVGQRTNRAELFGFALMTFGVFYMVSLTEIALNDKIILVLLLLVRGLAQAGQKLIAEFHKTNRKAEGFRHTSRVTAFVVGVSSVLLTIIFMGLGYLKQKLAITGLVGMPVFDDFFNLQALLTATFVGCVVLSFSKYCEFYAAKKISAKYLASIISLQPIFAIGYESSLASFGLMELRTFSYTDYIAMVCVMGGSVIIALSGMRKQSKRENEGKAQDNWNETMVDEMLTTPHKIAHVQDMAEASLSFFKGDFTKAAEALGVEETVFDNLLELEEGAFQITEKLAEKIQENYTLNVSSADPVTGLMNRMKFLSKFKSVLKATEHCSVLFIDLNKFKPVNDTYGHDAGDAILKGVAERLVAAYPAPHHVTRLGGDEYAVLLVNVNHPTAETEASKVRKLLQKPFTYEGHKIEIGGSVGIATAPQHGDTAEELLKFADESMYKEKESR